MKVLERKKLTFRGIRCMCVLAVFAVVARVLLIFASFRTTFSIVDSTAQWFSRLLGNHSGNVETLVRAKSIAYLANAVFSRSPIPLTCLHRSLALYWYIRSLSIDCNLRVGVRSDGTGIGAHAWIEVDGVSLDPRSVEYAPFDPLDANSVGASGS